MFAANGEAVQAVRKAVIEAKILLSTAETAKLGCAAAEREADICGEITRAQFEELIAPE